MARYADQGLVDWVESGGGPLVVVPAEALTRWEGADSEGPESDYDRACAVVGFTGLLAVGPSHALVLGDEPSSTVFLPEYGVFVRWLAAETEAELLGGVGAALEDAAWEEGQVWDVPGPVVLFDSAWPGSEVEPDNHARVDLAAGRYEVRAALVQPNSETAFQLVQLVPLVQFTQPLRSR
ncbi:MULTISPECIES: Imm21 family immunity protein [unclassified Streptomyces]|uniref:Imm21 family immunity protein n=1 Tax=unclassified Streptomyces TaxID=2593676 RepID=UPI002E27E0FC|nr:Imm21 family immunity protein [Streptomyces sp. NBC_00273]